MSADDRLRIHPKERLSGDVQHVDLSAAASRLRAEPHAATHGHRQVALVRHGPVSVLLFVFDPGGELKEHRTDGEVTIQVLTGELKVTFDEGSAVIGRGELLSLRPGQAHAVRAVEASEMLLTITQRESESPPSPLIK
jgi:quercetin dioxygenase-like cupin family protein